MHDILIPIYWLLDLLIVWKWWHDNPFYTPHLITKITFFEHVYGSNCFTNKVQLAFTICSKACVIINKYRITNLKEDKLNLFSTWNVLVVLLLWILTLKMQNFLNGIIHFPNWNCPLSYLGMSRWEFEEQYRSWSDCTNLQVGLGLYFWQLSVLAV